MSTTLGKTLLDKYEIHVTVHNCGLKSCETRTGLWDRYMDLINPATGRTYE